MLVLILVMPSPLYFTFHKKQVHHSKLLHSRMQSLALQYNTDTQLSSSCPNFLFSDLPRFLQFVKSDKGAVLINLNIAKFFCKCVVRKLAEIFHCEFKLSETSSEFLFVSQTVKSGFLKNPEP
jgi:hypothetical protein